MFATAKKEGVGVSSRSVSTPRDEPLRRLMCGLRRLEEDCGRQSSVDDEMMMSVVPDKTLLLTNSHGV